MATRLIRFSELRKHDGESADAWICVNGAVYDISRWAHPGGQVSSGNATQWAVFVRACRSSRLRALAHTGLNRRSCVRTWGATRALRLQRTTMWMSWLL
jgi:hypothetical protein